MLDKKTYPRLQKVKFHHMTLTDATSEAIQQAILDGLFPPGSKLIPEMALMEKLGVSRTTLREALKRLEEQGLIVRRRGLGTFVCNYSILKDLSVNFGITEMINEAGLTPGTSFIDVKIADPDPEVEKALQMNKGEQVLIIERIRTANTRPVVLSVDIMPVHLLDEHLVDFKSSPIESLYQYMSNVLGIRVARGMAQIIPAVASKEMAEKLNVRRGTPLLCIIQTDIDPNDRPVLHAIEYHLPDAFIFLVNRKGLQRQG